jgi:hypothetical protein
MFLSGHRLFASSLTGALFCIFLFPLLTISHLVADRNVQFWIGMYPALAFLVPVFWLCVHAFHVYKGKAHTDFVVASFVGPSVLFFLIGGSILFQATHVTDGLLTADCPHFRAIRPVEQAWQDASTVLETCRADLQKPDAILPNCKQYVDEYDLDASHQAMWSYLRYVEDEYRCAGFCTAHPGGLWQKEPFTDGCASAVASALRSRVIHSGWQLMLFSVVVMTGFLGWLAMLGKEEEKARRLTGSLPA